VQVARFINLVNTFPFVMKREDPLESNPILNQLFMEIGNDDSESVEPESTLNRLQGIKADYQNRVQKDIDCQKMISAAGESE